MVLRSTLMQRAMEALFDEKQFAKATVDAFVHRAQQVYGIAITPS
jgi:ribosome-associated toxin RatA of RatAB toxin-antitoxin module